MKEENGKKIVKFDKEEFFEEVKREFHKVAEKESGKEKRKYNYGVGEWIELDLIYELPHGEFKMSTKLEKR